MKKTLLLAATVAGIFTFGASAHAGDALLSPKAKAFADSLRTVPGTTPDLIDRSVRAGSPKAWNWQMLNERRPAQRPTCLYGTGLPLLRDC